MARNLADLTEDEVSTLLDEIAVVLRRLDCAGSNARQYSIYEAVLDEYEKAKFRRAAAIDSIKG